MRDKIIPNMTKYHYLNFMKQKIFDQFMRVTQSFITDLKMP